ncbi:ABC transporter ATP-binding protein [Streptococcus iniae]|uniref:ABC transporter ATP-binding protein n=1 Tax=Streptococcus iniae TaxID=1346 RepID=UPI000334813E|nr:ABC transporter ATP-binding protein [Streptococcus iniae]AGM99007.1 polysaccharide/polyolphosphate ABC transporter ATPase [Streptococcus iniae SF1]APD31992.1 phosphate/phosphonate ABC transporter ATP-binding protein [Streptococcus iniae]AYB01097.1 ABC transporter ATP-binding protein [Streptococcus iniae]AYB02961.1 ABC transporter ATP-binding protein [Streptococcus iniae]OAS96129.1 phosphate/phosphonate ABC transporter ATP-binding protein [Streptococcus iniae]
MSEKKVVLSVDSVSKSFKLPTEASHSLRTSLVNYFKGIKGYTEQHVLDNVSFEVEEGDFFGIVGRNGSGKSTLLKIISKIYDPEKGKVTVDGKLVPFIELGVGFNPELTGRENVYMNGALLGFSREEVEAMYNDIVAFAELHEFMDQKLKNYSSGMQVRLAFSIAIKAKGDILILDEVLAVGDEAFQRKCFDYFAQLKRDNKTVILVTHSMEQVQRFCNKAMLIDKGHQVEAGTPLEISQIYKQLNGLDVAKESNKKTENNGISLSSQFFNRDNKTLDFNFEVHFEDIIEDPVLTFTIHKDTGELLYRWVSDEEIDGQLEVSNAKISIDFAIQNIYPNGKFTTEFGVKSRDRSKEYAMFSGICDFELINRGKSGNNIYWKPETKVNLH